MKLRVIEAFAGIGAQAKALRRISEANPNFDYEIVSTIEWEIGAMYAYDLIHHGKQDLEKYKKYKKEELVEILSKFNLSSDGKSSLEKNSLKRMPLEQLKAIYHSIENNHNLVDISSVHAWDLPEADLLTYSFPCQDLSVSSYWHKNFSGIDRDANNRSSLLWQIERILKEYDEHNLEKPRFLLMENVTAIKRTNNVANFGIWQQELRNLGYRNYTDLDLDAKNFGIPQSRVRTYMLSVLVDDNETWNNIRDLLDNSNLHQILENPEIDPFLRLDYSNEQYYQEAVESTPNTSPSRDLILRTSRQLAICNETQGMITKTITTKQDRKPNAGIVVHNLVLEGRAIYRNLTPRETFLLMGFDEDDFDILISNNIRIAKNRYFLSKSKLLKLSGNSIVVNVLEQIFLELIQIENLFFRNIVHLNNRRIG